MRPAGIRLGVDFGTSNTVAVLRWPDGRARPLLFDGSPLLPSAVYAEPDGTLVLGRDAVHSARLDPARFEPNPKRRIDDGTLLLGDREIPVGQLIGAVLGHVAAECRRAAGDASLDVTLTCPASWGATRRLTLLDAAASAGLGDVHLVVEPVAAASYFTSVLGREVPIGSVVVVHDFGAGTFDASVVARTSSGFDVLAVDGRDDIGGLDIDEAVVERIGQLCAERDAAGWQRLVNPSTVEERRARRLLWDDARVAKERLSRSPTADITVPLLGVDVHLTRDELEALARPLLDATVRVTQGVMRWAKLAEGRLAGVFLVGGSSRMPLVATLLHRALGEAPVVIEQPELVVAEGSMLAEGSKLGVADAQAPVASVPVAEPLPTPVSPSPPSAENPTPAGRVSGRAAVPVAPARANGAALAPPATSPAPRTADSAPRRADSAPRPSGRAAVRPVVIRSIRAEPVAAAPGPPKAVRSTPAPPKAVRSTPAPPTPARPRPVPVRSAPVRPPAVRSARPSGGRTPRAVRPANVYRHRGHPVLRAVVKRLFLLLLAVVLLFAAYVAYEVVISGDGWPADIPNPIPSRFRH